MKQFAGALILRDETVLMVQESHKEARGLWSLPLESVEEGESPEEAAARETKEEAGFDVVVHGTVLRKTMKGSELKTLSEFSDEVAELFIYSATINGGEISIGEDVLDVEWKKKADLLKDLNLRGTWIKKLLNTID